MSPKDSPASRLAEMALKDLVAKRKFLLSARELFPLLTMVSFLNFKRKQTGVMDDILGGTQKTAKGEWKVSK